MRLAVEGERRQREREFLAGRARERERQARRGEVEVPDERGTARAPHLHDRARAVARRLERAHRVGARVGIRPALRRPPARQDRKRRRVRETRLIARPVRRTVRERHGEREHRRRAAPLDAPHAVRVVGRVARRVQLHAVVARPQEHAVEGGRGLEDRRGGRLVGGGNRLVREEASKPRPRPHRHHVLVEIAVALAPLARREREAVLDVAVVRLAQPVAERIDGPPRHQAEARRRLPVAPPLEPGRIPFAHRRVEALAVEELVAPPAVGQLARRGLHEERRLGGPEQPLLQGRARGPVVAIREGGHELEARDGVVHHRLVRVAVHAVHVEEAQLVRDVALHVGGASAKPREDAQLLARGAEDGPVVGDGVARARLAAVGRLGDGPADVRPPGLRHRRRVDLRLLDGEEAEDDLLDGEVVPDAMRALPVPPRGLQGRRHLRAAGVHHRAEEGAVRRPPPMRDEDAEVRGEPREAVFEDALLLHPRVVGADVIRRVRPHRRLDEIEVFALRDARRRPARQGKAAQRTDHDKIPHGPHSPCRFDRGTAGGRMDIFERLSADGETVLDDRLSRRPRSS